jgi:hypothetical protein
MASIAWSAELTQGRRLGVLQKPPALLGRQPISQPDAKTSHAFHAADTGGEFRAQETGVRRLVRHATNGRQAQVDRGGRVLPLLEVDPIAKNDGAIERETGL